ncbi:MAG: hypothetical protein WDZ52_12750 [Pseudohongiellaceae bacterium]
MVKILPLLLLSVVTTQSASAAEPQAADYTLSMAGALINDHCTRTWQSAEFVNIHACNYQLANQFTLEIASTHFNQCTVAARGDIVMIADCMVAGFESWLDAGQQNNN